MSDYTTLVDPLRGRSWRVPNNRLNPWHTITIKPDSWHIAHPVTCDLDSCPFEAVVRMLKQPPRDNGTYRWLDTVQKSAHWVEVTGDE